MDITNISDAPQYDQTQFVAVPFLEGELSNVRVIRLSPGQSLPNHTHGPTEVMLFAIEGEGTMQTDDGAVPFGAGSLARVPVGEELRITNEGTVGLTMLAFLTPPFPPRDKS